MRKFFAVVVGGPIILLFGSILVLTFLFSSGGQAGVSGGLIDLSRVPAGPVAGFSGEQLRNAAHIMNAGYGLGLDTRDQTIGVTAAIGESSLQVLDHGDNAGPDSRGLFQQRGNGAWGSYEDRMDPHTSATNFFRAMVRLVPERAGLEPTIIIHTVQVNRDPNHYARFWSPAVEIVQTLLEVASVSYGDSGSEAAGPWGEHSNGRIPLSSLCPVSWQPRHHLRCDAVAALTQMNAAYKTAFGRDIQITDGYRTFDEQVHLKRIKPGLSATPGTSNHGWALALDLGGGINSFGSSQHSWMRENAGRWCWVLPAWAQETGSLPEPWHWEFAC